MMRERHRYHYAVPPTPPLQLPGNEQGEGFTGGGLKPVMWRSEMPS